MAAAVHGRVLQQTRQSSTSTTFADVSGASITSGNFVDGKQYLLFVTGLIDTTDTNRAARVRLVHGSTTFQGSEHREESDTAAARIQYSHWTVYTAVSGEDVKLQLASEFATAEVGIDEIQMVWIKLSDDFTEDTDWFFDQVVANTTLSDTETASNNATVTFTPANADDVWLVLGRSVVSSITDITISYQSRLLRTGEATETLGEVIKEPEDINHILPLPHMAVLQLGAASNTFTEKSLTSSTATTEQRIMSSVFALNLSKFRNVAFFHDVAKVDLSATSFATQVATATITPDIEGDVWAVGYWVSDLGQPFYSKSRLQVDGSDDPAGQTTNDYAVEDQHDPRDQAALIVQTLSNQTAAAQVYDVDGSTEIANVGRGAMYRSLFAVTMELAEADPTRFYLTQNSSLVAPVSPAVDTDWEQNADGFVRRRLSLTKRSDTVAGHSSLFGDTATGDTLWAQFVSPALDVNQTIDGTMDLVMEGLQGGPDEDAHLAFILRVVDSSLAERGVLASSLTTGTELVDGATFDEAETRIFEDVALTPVAAQAGDYIVLEIGVHAVTPANTDEIVLFYGADDAGTDFALTEGLTDGVPWLELSKAITFDLEDVLGTGEPIATLGATATGEATETFIGSGAATANSFVASAAGDATHTPPDPNEVIGFGSPIATLGATAEGVATVMGEDVDAEGAATAALNPVAEGEARERFLGAGAASVTLTAAAVGVATYVFPGEDPPPPPRARGGTRRFVYDKPAEVKPKKKRKQPPPTPEATPPDVAFEPLSPIVPSTIDPAAWAQILTPGLPSAGPAPIEPETYPPIGDIDEALLRHFMETMGMPELDMDDLPVMVRRFLRMGQ